MTTARNCLLYARYSTDRQNPKSCDDQLREARRYAAGQGWAVVGQYQDAGVSGTKGRGDRSGWDHLLAFIEQGGLEAGGVVLTWDIDRWSRDWADGMIEALRLHKLGVDLADTKDGVLQQAGLAGKILLTLKVAGSAEFIDKLRRGVIRGLDAKRAAGYWTGTPPFGYAISRESGGSVLVADPLEAPELVSVFVAMAQGAAAPDIARGLNARRVATRRCTAWTPATVRDIVRSPTYLGFIPIYRSRSGPRQRARSQYDPAEIELLPGRHAPLVDRDLWERAQQAVSRRGTGGGPGRPRPLSGLVVCGVCGKRCHVTGGLEPWRYYRCRPYGVTDPRCDSRRTIRIDQLEASVRALGRAILAEATTIEASAARAVEAGWKAASAARAARGPVQLRVRELEHKQERLLAALYEGGAPALINARLSQVAADLDSAQAELASVGSDVEPLSIADVVAETRAMLEGPEADLTWTHHLGAQIIVPREGPPWMRVMGQEFDLLGAT